MLERFSPDARAAVASAQENAREVNAGEIRPEHLFLGVLQSAGRELSALLAGYGMTVEEARGRQVDGDAGVTDPPFAKSSKLTLQVAFRTAERYQDQIDCEHILLAMLFTRQRFVMGFFRDHSDVSELVDVLIERVEVAA